MTWYHEIGDMKLRQHDWRSIWYQCRAKTIAGNRRDVSGLGKPWKIKQIEPLQQINACTTVQEICSPCSPLDGQCTKCGTWLTHYWWRWYRDSAKYWPGMRASRTYSIFSKCTLWIWGSPKLMAIPIARLGQNADFYGIKTLAADITEASICRSHNSPALSITTLE